MQFFKAKVKRFQVIGLQRAMLFVALCFIPLPALAQQPVTVKMDDSSFAAGSKKRGLYLDVRVKDASELVNTSKIYVGHFDLKGFTYKKYNIEKLSRTRVLIPYLSLSQAFKRVFLNTMWPKDKLVGKQWRHQVRYDFETLWTISQMYTGFGNNYTKIQKHNGMRSSSVSRGMTIRIPETMLMELIRVQPDLTLPKPKDPVFAVQTPTDPPVSVREDKTPEVSQPTPAQSKPKPEPAKPSITTAQNKPKQQPPKKNEKADDGHAAEVKQALADLESMRRELTWDPQRRYATYRLKRGEAIYSSVVVRFCGLLKAREVNQLAEKIIRYNKIPDPTDIEIGTAIRIPYEHLDPEFLAADDERYLAYVDNLEDVGRLQVDATADRLKNVYLILDAGHGGRDPGADRSHVWEDDFVYDILCRIKKRIEDESEAVVYTTILDPSVNYKVQDVNRFRRDQDEVLLTTPRFPLSDKRVTTDGVNLRWMLANNRYQKLRKQGVPSQNIVFASIHADALHPSVRGAMVYVPDARQFDRRVSPPSGRLSRYKEREGNTFSFTASDLKEAQARSMAFSNRFLRALRDRDGHVHKHKPIRSLIYRNPRKPFVPAVLRFNRVPSRVLIEVCNLNNKYDRAMLRDPKYRQKVADAFVSAVYRTYGVNATAALSRLNGPSTARGDR